MLAQVATVAHADSALPGWPSDSRGLTASTRGRFERPRMALDELGLRVLVVAALLEKQSLPLAQTSVRPDQ